MSVLQFTNNNYHGHDHDTWNSSSNNRKAHNSFIKVHILFLYEWMISWKRQLKLFWKCRVIYSVEVAALQHVANAILVPINELDIYTVINFAALKIIC